MKQLSASATLAPKCIQCQLHPDCCPDITFRTDLPWVRMVSGPSVRTYVIPEHCSKRWALHSRTKPMFCPDQAQDFLLTCRPGLKWARLYTPHISPLGSLVEFCERSMTSMVFAGVVTGRHFAGKIILHSYKEATIYCLHISLISS